MIKIKILFSVLTVLFALIGFNTAFAVNSLPAPAIFGLWAAHINQPKTIEEIRLADLRVDLAIESLKGLTLEMKTSTLSPVKITAGKDDEFNVEFCLAAGIRICLGMLPMIR